jgi:hypothetical protein
MSVVQFRPAGGKDALADELALRAAEFRSTGELRLANVLTRASAAVREGEPVR